MRIYTKIPIEERFWKKVIKKTTFECWEWNAAKNPNGYGLIGLGSKKDGLIKAHRASWIIKFGNIPNNMCVLHKCDNPKCVNPEHLFLGNQLDNVCDCISKKRHSQPPVRFGEKNNKSKLSKADVIEIKKIFNSSNISQRKFAKKYNVSHGTIGAILRNKTWKEV